MNVRQAIKELQLIERAVGGDVELISMTDVDGRFCIDTGRVFDLIEIPPPGEDVTPGQKLTLVCAYMDPIDENAGEPAPRILRVIQ